MNGFVSHYPEPRIVIPRGGSKQIKITLRDRDCVPVDLSTLSKLELTVKLSLDAPDGEALVHKKIPLTYDGHNLENGEVVLSLEEIDTRFIPRGTYFWDLRGERTHGTSPFFFPNPPGLFVVSGVANLGQTPPEIVEDFVASKDQIGEVSLSWTNPADSDLAEVVVMRSKSRFPKDHTDGSEVFRTHTPIPGDPLTVVDLNVEEGDTYYYAVFSRDQVFNWQDAVEHGKNADTGVALSV